MSDSIHRMLLELLKNRILARKCLPSFTKRCNGRHYVTFNTKSVNHFMACFISFRGATSCDKWLICSSFNCAYEYFQEFADYF